MDVVKYLVSKGVNIEAKDKRQQTPLHYACKLEDLSYNLSYVEYLISKGANIEAKDEKNETPLHIASKCGSIDIIKYLISKGANKYPKNKDGKTPYDLACEDLAEESQNDEEKRNFLKSKKDEIRNILK